MHIFLIILIVAVGTLLSLVAISLYLSATSPSYYQSSWMNQIWQSMGIGRSTSSGNNGGMGGMMGGNGTGTTTSNLWIIPIAIIAAAVVGIIGFGFYTILPEIKNTRRTCDPVKNEPISTISTKTSGTDVPVSNAASNSCDVILKTMTLEEQKVLTVLVAHQGRYLQKYVGKEAGLSRLKTHRIVARFAERGIVTVKPLGNTNEVTVSDWVNGSKAQS
ncbi:MAG: hypothetical protein ABSD92_07050 [Candidatus Bathyarchaeia archaeon]